MLLQQKRLLQDARSRVNVRGPLPLKPTLPCPLPPPSPSHAPHTPILHQILQQSIDHALHAVRVESEEQLRSTAQFISPKWPQLRAEITKVVKSRLPPQLPSLSLLFTLDAGAVCQAVTRREEAAEAALAATAQANQRRGARPVPRWLRCPAAQFLS